MSLKGTSWVYNVHRLSCPYGPYPGHRKTTTITPIRSKHQRVTVPTPESGFLISYPLTDPLGCLTLQISRGKKEKTVQSMQNQAMVNLNIVVPGHWFQIVLYDPSYKIFLVNQRNSASSWSRHQPISESTQRLFDFGKRWTQVQVCAE